MTTPITTPPPPDTSPLGVLGAPFKRGAASRDLPSNSAWSTKLSNIMIVDDEQYNILTVKHHLKEAGYQQFTTTTDPASALALMWEARPDIVLLDVMMPGITGMELLEVMRGDAQLANTPVIIVTASDDPSVKLQALELGATDFLSKPVDASELVLRIRNTLLIKNQQDRLSNYSAELEREVQRRTAELEMSQREVVYCLASAGESRDSQTGYHVTRVSMYAGIIANQLGFNSDQVERLELAVQLHDVGKIGINDSILLKPGRLSSEEFEIMKKHCEYGVQIILSGSQAGPGEADQTTGIDFDRIRKCRSPFMRLAATIAATHHEKWDGSGYPCQLSEREIPIEGRITAVADVFDALTSARPYKEAFSVEKALSIMNEGRGSHFDPNVYDAFVARRDDVVGVLENYTDAD